MKIELHPRGDSASTPTRADAPTQATQEGTRTSRWAATLLALAGLVGAAGQARAYDPPPAGFFPIGVFLQPTSTFDTWQSRGINTVVDYWGDQTALEQWNAAATSRGLYMIRGPRADLAKDVNEKHLLAWSQHDEPDYNGISSTQTAATYAVMKAADPKRPVYLNLAGGLVVNPYNYSTIDYKGYLKSGDWIANDIYPVTAWNHPEWIDFSKPLNPKDIYNPTPTIRLNPGTTIDLLRNQSGGKPQYAYIETSWQDNSGPVAGPRGVTADEFRGEVWDAIIHGAKGVVYFPQRVGATVFLNDNTPADVAAEMKKQDALITSLSGAITTGDDTKDNRVPFNNADLEGTWRTFQGKQYLFVLNMSSQTLSNLAFTTTGLTGVSSLQVYNELRSEDVLNGAITDTFNPYQLHVYVAGGNVGTPPIISAAVPEPTGTAILLGLAGWQLLARRRRGIGAISGADT